MTILMLLFVVILNTSIDLHQAAISFYVYFIFMYIHLNIPRFTPGLSRPSRSF